MNKKIIMTQKEYNRIKLCRAKWSLRSIVCFLHAFFPLSEIVHDEVQQIVCVPCSLVAELSIDKINVLSALEHSFGQVSQVDGKCLIYKYF